MNITLPSHPRPVHFRKMMIESGAHMARQAINFPRTSSGIITLRTAVPGKSTFPRLVAPEDEDDEEEREEVI